MYDEQIQKNRYKLFTAGAIGTFMATLDGSILNVALPTIADNFAVDVGLVAWVVLAYSLTLMSLMLVFGAWTQGKGYAFAYRFGYSFFLVGSCLCALAPSIYLLIAARVIQAIGTSMFAAIGPGMVTTVFPREERGKGIGLMVMMVSAGFMVGPPLGGFILGIWSWHGIFLINIPIGLFGLIMVHKYFRMLKPPKDAPPLRFAAAVTISAAIVAGVFAMSLVDNVPLSSPEIWIPAAISIVLLVLFVRLEANPGRAMIGLDIFRNRVFSASMAAQLMHFGGLSGVLILVPFYLERIKLLEPQQVGLYLVIIPIMMFVFAPLAGRLSDKIGYKVLTSLGMILMGLGLYLMTALAAETDFTYIILCLVVVGGGVGIFSTPNSSAMMGSVTEKQRAVASGILATNRNLGMSIGVALSTALFTYFKTQNAGLGDEAAIFLASYHPVMYVGMAFALFGVVFCLVRGNRSGPKSQAGEEIAPSPVKSG